MMKKKERDRENVMDRRDGTIPYREPISTRSGKIPPKKPSQPLSLTWHIHPGTNVCTAPRPAESSRRYRISWRGSAASLNAWSSCRGV